jgi:hypothetical protein
MVVKVHKDHKEVEILDLLDQEVEVEVEFQIYKLLQ